VNKVMKNIYFCGSIAGGRQYLEVYQKIVAYLKAAGRRVLTEHVVHPDVLAMEKRYTPEQIYVRDIEWLKECDGVIAEVSNPSLGVGMRFVMLYASVSRCFVFTGGASF